MAAGILAAPGSENGPCRHKCKHVDCREDKKMANAKCTYCDKRIGWNKRFYVLKDNTLVHAVCHEKAAMEKDSEQ